MADQPSPEAVAAVEALEARWLAAEQALLRLEVIEAKEMSVGMARFLRGTTKAEIEADADKLLAEVASARKSKRPPAFPERQPREKLKPGRTIEAHDDGDDLLSAIKRAFS